MKPRYVLLSGVSLVLTACSSGSSGTPAASASRTVEVTMTDELRFDPSEITVAAGETVRFEVHNAGQIVHEFYVGDEDAQAQHEDEMRESGGGMMHDEPAGVSVAPGQTEMFEFTFGEAGALQAGCHEAGHYAAGMIATITVGG